MSELISILETLITDVDMGRPAALCTVVARKGSAPQTPGATMLVRSDAGAFGTVGGGAPEAEVQRRALELLQEGRSALLELALDHDYGLGEASICGGRMSVAIMPIMATTNLGPFQAALELARRHQPAQLPIVVERESKRLEYRLHVEVPPTLVMAGAGHVGQAVARLAVDLGFHVVVIDDRAEIAARTRFNDPIKLIVGDITQTLQDYQIDPSCYVVIATRGHAYDQQALEAVIRRPATYIGMIASKRKAAFILKALAKAGVPQDLLDRVYTPIGLSIGAVTVKEIAVSILAELIQTRRQNTPTLIEGPIETAL